MARDYTLVRVSAETLVRLEAVRSGLLADPLLDQRYPGLRNVDRVNPSHPEISLEGVISVLLAQREQLQARRAKAKRGRKNGKKRPKKMPVPNEGTGGDGSGAPRRQPV